MRSLLLDTNVVVWLLLGERESVSPAARRQLEDAGNALVVSAASVWEIAVKRSLGKLEIAANWQGALWTLDLEPIPVTPRHAELVEILPWHHRDPFDRLLVAQAISEAYPLVSADVEISRYDVEVIW